MDDLTERGAGARSPACSTTSDWDSGYSKQQSTRPQTLGYGLADSPAGQAAWILEKIWAWTDCDGHPENALTRDEMLDNIMLYWLTGTGASSARLYWESFRIGSGPSAVTVPTGCSIFPKEIFRRRGAGREALHRTSSTGTSSTAAATSPRSSSPSCSSRRCATVSGWCAEPPTTEPWERLPSRDLLTFASRSRLGSRSYRDLSNQKLYSSEIDVIVSVFSESSEHVGVTADRVGQDRGEGAHELRLEAYNAFGEGVVLTRLSPRSKLACAL